ncbi:MAG: N-acetyl-gamma-glutamyl-phosphate reductase [Candidatus Binatia bacterium]
MSRAVSSVIQVAIAGATGYSGIELVRLLALHPAVEIRRVTSEQYAGKRLSDVYRSLRGRTEAVLQPLEARTLGRDVDVVFTALPHGAAAATIVQLLETKARVVDLSADFRLRDAAVFRRWYGEHPAPGLLSEAVYGIPEFSRERIRSARLVAVPGCYPTGALFALLPLARSGSIGEGAIVVDAKAGASGAGRGAKTDLLFCEIDENVRAYGVGSHRHGPEIEQELRLAGGTGAVLFTPHLLPIRRGILSTVYVPLRPGADPDRIYTDAFGAEPFVQLLGRDVFPDVRDVRGTNDVQMGWTIHPSGGTAIVVTAIDNLGKGAAGQAVQNMNVMFGLDERTGLRELAAVP